jgi:hypothetical protein
MDPPSFVSMSSLTLTWDTADLADVGTYNITVVATLINGQTASASFPLSVEDSTSFKRILQACSQSLSPVAQTNIDYAVTASESYTLTAFTSSCTYCSSCAISYSLT